MFRRSRLMDCKPQQGVRVALFSGENEGKWMLLLRLRGFFIWGLKSLACIWKDKFSFPREVFLGIHYFKSKKINWLYLLVQLFGKERPEKILFSYWECKQKNPGSKLTPFIVFYFFSIDFISAQIWYYLNYFAWMLSCHSLYGSCQKNIDCWLFSSKALRCVFISASRAFCFFL